jgi:hypothetical protein
LAARVAAGQEVLLAEPGASVERSEREPGEATRLSRRGEEGDQSGMSPYNFIPQKATTTPTPTQTHSNKHLLKPFKL